MAQWLACWAHNPKVPGSKPGSAILRLFALDLAARNWHPEIYTLDDNISISGLVVEYIVAIDVTRVRFPADALFSAY